MHEQETYGNDIRIRNSTTHVGNAHHGERVLFQVCNKSHIYWRKTTSLITAQHVLGWTKPLFNETSQHPDIPRVLGVPQVSFYKLYLANAGDSVSFVVVHWASTHQTCIVYMSRAEDKPELPEEQERIERMDGRVLVIPNHIDGSSATSLAFWY